MYVILTSKPGQFRTEAGPELRPVQGYDYFFYGRHQARFVISEISGESKVRITDEGESASVNLVPTKFLEKYASLAQAERELKHLCAFGSMDANLVPFAPHPD